VTTTDDLTKDQQFLLISLYKEYLSRQPALDPLSANYFEDSDSLISLLNLNYSSDYVAAMCLSLLDKGYIIGCKDDDSVSELGVSDDTIIYMENRFKKNLKELVSFLTSLIP
jgi:hypothetical protein